MNCSWQPWKQIYRAFVLKSHFVDCSFPWTQHLQILIRPILSILSTKKTCPSGSEHPIDCTQSSSNHKLLVFCLREKRIPEDSSVKVMPSGDSHGGHRINFLFLSYCVSQSVLFKLRLGRQFGQEIPQHQRTCIGNSGREGEGNNISDLHGINKGWLALWVDFDFVKTFDLVKIFDLITRQPYELPENLSKIIHTVILNSHDFKITLK